MGTSVRLIRLDLPIEGAKGMATALREFVPEIAREAVRQVQHELPSYVQPHDARYAEGLLLAVEYAIGHFIDLMADPDTPSAEVLEFWRNIGVGEAAEGRSLDPWQAAMRIGAGVAVRRLTEESERLGQPVTAGTIALVAQAVFAYLDQLAVVVADGHSEAAARSAGELQGHRRRLLDLLVGSPAPQHGAIKERARAAEWTLPRTVAAVALHDLGGTTQRPMLPTEVLLGLHLDEPSLILPDPGGPRRGQMLTAGLKGWLVSVGPAVEITELGKSLRWARQALDLARQGMIRHEEPIIAEQHVPLILMMQDRELAERFTARKLAPLIKARPSQRERLAETLLASLECGFNATEVASRLEMHAQTIRYRLRQLETLFGTSIYDPAERLELHMALHVWLSIRPESESDPEG
ncbi:MAG: helix-turn-helix domain-containing protein [Streptosporangiaceae bacterium]